MQSKGKYAVVRRIMRLVYEVLSLPFFMSGVAHYTYNKILFRTFLFAFLLITSLFLNSAKTSAQSVTVVFINKHRPLADSLSAQYGIPSAVILGVAIIESGSGTSRNCRLLNNYFGIVGKNNLLKTKGIKSRYKQYPDATASFTDFCRLLSQKKYYPKLKGNMNHTLWVDAISKSGYSEVPDVWKQRINDTIRKNKLSATTKNSSS